MVLFSATLWLTLHVIFCAIMAIVLQYFKGPSVPEVVATYFVCIAFLTKYEIIKFINIVSLDPEGSVKKIKEQFSEVKNNDK